MTSTYLGYQIYAGNMAQSLKRVGAEGAVSTAKAYYDANIGSVTSVDGFLGNYKLFSYAMKASGLEDMTYAKAFMRKVLTSDLGDPASFVNKLTDPRFKAFAEQFSFGSTGNAAAQSATQESRTVALYGAKTGSDSVSGILGTAYYEANIGRVKSVKDLEGDPQLLDYVMTAYGLDPTTVDKGSYAQSTAATNDLTAVFESDSSDPDSVAGQMARGAADTSRIPLALQSASQQAATSDAYTKRYGRTTDLIAYENTIGTVHSIDALLADPKLLSVAEQAYGLDPSRYSTIDVRRILTSDLGDPMSVANQLGFSAVAFAKAFNLTTSAASASPYTAIAQDFNFDRAGAIATARSVQSTVSIAATETLYAAKAGSSTAAKAAAAKETAYYTKTIGSLTNLSQLLSDTRLTAYIKTAYGLPGATSSDALRRILTSDLANPKSAANTMGGSARQVAAAFNVSTTGTLTRSTGSAQSSKAAAMTDDGYLEQNLEDEAGTGSQGVKLALYFRRKVTSGAVTSAYGVLADSALLKVVQTALGIPASSSSQNIDLQAKQISARLDLSSLNDPTKLTKFISRFAALYDSANGASSSSTITKLFGA